jgi:hypothetical protein
MAKNDSIEAIEDTTPVKARSLAEITGAIGAKLVKGEKVTVTNLTFVAVLTVDDTVQETPIVVQPTR